MKKRILLTTVIASFVAAMAAHAQNCKLDDYKYMKIQVANFSNSKLLLDMGKLTPRHVDATSGSLTEILPHHVGNGAMCNNGTGGESHIHLYRMPGHHDLVEWEANFRQTQKLRQVYQPQHVMLCGVPAGKP